MSTSTPIQQSILRTIAYFDVFDRPLTVPEIRRWLYRLPGSDVAAAAESDVENALRQPPLTDVLESDGGLWFLRGRRSIITTRQERSAASAKKWKVATTVGRWLQMAPFVRMVAVVNSLAMDHARDASDVDVLIVTAPGRMWIARMLVTGLVHMLGYRRYGNNIQDRVCLSFYVTQDALDMTPLRLNNEDHYYTFWGSQITPLLDEGVYEQFQKENPWIAERLPHGWEWDWRQRIVPTVSLRRSIKRFYEMFFSTGIGQMVETMARDQQLKKMDRNLNSKASQGTTEVIISDTVLKFHEDDRRARYNAAYEQRLRDLKLP